MLGALMLGEALALLAFGWHRFGLARDDGTLAMFAFQLRLFLALFSIISVRERRAFWTSRPGRLLGYALAGDATIAILLGVHGFSELRPLPPALIGGVIAYAAVCCLGVNDLVKTLMLARAFRRGGAQRPARRS